MFQCVERPSIPLTGELMAACDLTIATGGMPMVRAAYSSGKPAYGVGAGNSTMVIDETANIAEAARNTRISKTSDFGSGCSADGNLLIDESIYDKLRRAAVSRGRLPRHPRGKGQAAKRRCGTPRAIARSTRVAVSPQRIGADRRLRRCRRTASSSWSSRRASARSTSSPARSSCALLALFQYQRLRRGAAKWCEQIYEVGGKGHSCGIYSFDDDHIARLAAVAPVSRMMVRQPQSKANAGAFNNGMPMTSSLGCGIWGGNITNENIHLKHYMNVTWVSRPIPEDARATRSCSANSITRKRSDACRVGHD